MRIVLFMAKNAWTDEAAEAAARTAGRREAGRASVRAEGTRNPTDVTIPGAPEQEGRPPERQAGSDEAATPRQKAEPQVPGRHGEPDASPVRGASAREAPELLGERSDYPILYGEDPGDIGQ